MGVLLSKEEPMVAGMVGARGLVGVNRQRVPANRIGAEKRLEGMERHIRLVGDVGRVWHREARGAKRKRGGVVYVDEGKERRIFHQKKKKKFKKKKEVGV